jgi:hypothetical protein
MFGALALSPAAMDRGTVESATTAAGLELSTVDRLGSEWQEHDLEHDAPEAKPG